MKRIHSTIRGQYGRTRSSEPAYKWTSEDLRGPHAGKAPLPRLESPQLPNGPTANEPRRSRMHRCACGATVWFD